MKTVRTQKINIRANTCWISEFVGWTPPRTFFCTIKIYFLCTYRFRSLAAPLILVLRICMYSKACTHTTEAPVCCESNLLHLYLHNELVTPQLRIELSYQEFSRSIENHDRKFWEKKEVIRSHTHTLADRFRFS